jgi:hypothetical protein
MSKFKEGDKIVRIKNGCAPAPIGYTAIVEVDKVQLLYTSSYGLSTSINEDDWELAEDTSKPVTVTHEGNVYEVGKRYVFTDSLPLGDDFTVSRLNFIYVPNSDPSYVFDSEGLPYRYAVSLNEVNLDAGTITPEPIELIDGNAYMFNVQGNEVIGLYSSDDETLTSARYCLHYSMMSNIRPMTVTESK